MWTLSSDAKDGTWWRTECVAPFDECVRRAEEIDGGPLDFRETGPTSYRADGDKALYFMNMAAPDAAVDMEPGPVRTPYHG